MVKPPLPHASPREPQVYYWVSPSPVGRLLLAGSTRGLKELHFQDGLHPRSIPPNWKREHWPFRKVLGQLNQYFAGQLKKFHVSLDLQGSPFQLTVWLALQRIPYGQTVSYGEIAQKIGNPLAARAVGTANGQNPVSIIVPCHRVIGANGRLVGYGGGLPIKQALLNLERGGESD